MHCTVENLGTLMSSVHPLLYIKGCLESWVQMMICIPLFRDTSRDSYAVLQHDFGAL